MSLSICLKVTNTTFTVINKSEVFIMKKLLYAVMLLLGLSMMISCGGGDVSSLYGTYTGTDDYGNTISITLKPESSDNGWSKSGSDCSSNLVYKDYKGRIQSTDCQSITWSWNFDAGYVQTYYLDNKRTIIDFKHKKFYRRYGEFIDGRDGIPYTFRKQ